MISSGPARALNELAVRAQEMLGAYEPGFETTYHDLRAATPAPPRPALDPLSVAAPPATYFLGMDASGKPFYSRDGSFAITGGNVMLPHGAPALGFGPDAKPGDPPRPLHVDAVDAALGRVNDARIEADGSVVYTRTVIDPQSGKASKERVVAGRVAVARFPAGTELQRASATRVIPPAGITPTIGKPAEATFGALATQSRDLGSVDFEAGLIQIREAYLALDAMSAGGQAESRAAKVAVDLIK